MISIVIVDDRATNRTILAKLSRAYDPTCEVDCYGDPVEAIARLRERPVDLVITDFNMPNLNGAEFIRRVQDEIPGFDAPIVVITAYEDRTYRYDALEAGAADFLLSPIDHREFHTRVRNILAAWSRVRSARTEAVALREELTVEKAEHARTVVDSERRLRQVLDTNPSLIFTAGAAGDVTLTNAAFAAACGKRPDQVVGSRLLDCVPDPANARQLLDEIERFRRSVGSQRTSELSFLGADGRETFLQVVMSRMALENAVGDGSRGEVLTVATDISDRRAAERALYEAIDAANKSSRAKTAFLANMSHELRTPMNAIIGFADMMAREVLGPIGTPRYLEYVGHIRSSAHHLLGMISDVLDIARLEAGAMTLRETEIDLAQVIEEVRTITSFRADEGSVAMTTQVDPGIVLRADAAKLRQALINVLANALHATPSGGKVQLAAAVTADGETRIVVTDTGIGMSEHELEIALARFGRIERGEAHTPGAGLGLPLAIDLVHLHGGSVRVESNPGRGTVVAILLPGDRLLRAPIVAGSDES